MPLAFLSGLIWETNVAVAEVKRSRADGFNAYHHSSIIIPSSGSCTTRNATNCG
jgi:hypothetical protein